MPEKKEKTMTTSAINYCLSTSTIHIKHTFTARKTKHAKSFAHARAHLVVHFHAAGTHHTILHDLQTVTWVSGHQWKYTSLVFCLPKCVCKCVVNSQKSQIVFTSVKYRLDGLKFPASLLQHVRCYLLPAWRTGKAHHQTRARSRAHTFGFEKSAAYVKENRQDQGWHTFSSKLATALLNSTQFFQTWKKTLFIHICPDTNLHQ